MPWKYNFGSRSIVGLETGLLAQQGLTRCFTRLCFTMSLGISFRMSFCGGKRSMRYNYNFIKPVYAYICLLYIYNLFRCLVHFEFGFRLDSL